MSELMRCAWAEKTETYRVYHDHEWGVPNFNDQRLFESLSLQIMQAGLTWSTILHRRDAFCLAFDHFDVDCVATFDESKVTQLLDNSDIIRNRKKINAIIHNAQCVQDIKQSYGNFADFLWQQFDKKPICNRFERLSDIPAFTSQSDHLTRSLKKYGVKFIGSTICYAFMQANGMVNDHLISCPQWRQVQQK